MAEIILKALEGSNSLAYLAAIGTLRVATLAWPEKNVRLSWKNLDGGWRPCIHNCIDMDIDVWLAGLYSVLNSGINEPAFTISDDLNLSCLDFRVNALDAQNKAQPTDRNYADFIAAFGSESVELLKNGKKSGLMTDTALRTMSGAGNQHFLEFLRELTKVTNVKNISDSLFIGWSYSDTGLSLRWDPADDRRYALRWLRPSTDPVKTERGANRLAIEALPLLPSMPCRGRLETTGFTQRKRQNVSWTWPIWTSALNIDVVRSLLAMPELQRISPNRTTLYAMSIEEIYRSERITQGKFRNFTMAVSV
jgi:hypothetical protein